MTMARDGGRPFEPTAIPIVYKLWTMTASTSLLLLLQLTLLGGARSIPFSVLVSGKGYCRSAEVAKDTIVKIHFLAPDIDPEAVDRKVATYLSINEKPTQSALEAIDEENGERKKPPYGSTGRVPPPVAHEMKHKEGSYVHTVRQDSEVTICIRAPAAATKNPMRFAFRLEEMGDDEAPESKLPPAAAAETVDNHLSFMEQQLDRIESQMHAVLREADLARERDSIYHTKTDAMHKATTFWPIVHVGILLVTGFTQANHIVQFFKKRRII